ncbi:endonuclease [Mesohalobacter halotolerans]|uniref:T9SS type A sorting domain-containing protein n=1 Tax=Mesohalobacter halotolerans TaxID=1883405 RepID=A0A4U5TSV1_9FLAO|nr:endonuclease [Mesohalobacter halotolerans]TKS57410.1 T9SS type A sorting domain-containing protein [Mesohalobacter halotolerans]
MYFRLLILLFAYSTYAQIPSYYSSIDFSQSNSDIKNQLASLITATHVEDFPYTSNNTDTWDILKLSDEVLSSPVDVYLVYGSDDSNSIIVDDYTRAKSLSCHQSGCSGLWNREHVFARSLANPPLVTDVEGSGTDVHNLKPCDGDMNSIRSNRVFEDSFGVASITQNGSWFPGDEWKGDVARIVMYMYLRYNNQCLPNTIANSNNTYNVDMPDIFLQWNVEDPVSPLEIQRNNIIASFQGNRNPFIDNPYLASLIWGGPIAQDTWNTFSTVDNFFSNITIVPTFADDSISVSNADNLILYYYIYNISGRLVQLDSLENKVIDISNLSDGIYILAIHKNHKRKVFKFYKK